MNTVQIAGLAGHISQKIRRGRLPRDSNVRIFTGRGTGFPCVCCERVIGRAEVEYEIEVDPLDASSLCVMHVSCYLLWSSVRSALEAEADTGTLVAMNAATRPVHREPLPQDR